MPSGVRAYVLAPVYYVVALALAILIIANANDASRAYESASAHETVSAKTDRALRETLESLSLGLYGGGSELAEQLADAIDVAQFHEARATGAGWLLFGISRRFSPSSLSARSVAAAGPVPRLSGTCSAYLESSYL